MPFRYFYNAKTLGDAQLSKVKPDQAHVLNKLFDSEKEGLTDADLAAFNENGEALTGAEGEKALRVKPALLRTGLVRAEQIVGERAASERMYEHTGNDLGEHFSDSMKKVGGAVIRRGRGTKTQFAETYREMAAEAGHEISLEHAVKSVSGVWLRLQDTGIIRRVKKNDDKPAAAAGTETPENLGNGDAPVDSTAGDTNGAEY